MEKEFVPYEQAFALKELGFDERPCFATWIERDKRDGGGIVIEMWGDEDTEYSLISKILAPTFSQTFRWFREKYDLVSWVRRRPGFVKEYSWYVSDFNDEDPDEYYFDLHIETYEEAELECLKKLIEIVKEK